MQPHAALNAGEIAGMLGEIREKLDLDGGEKRLRAPEGEAGLQDVIRSEVHRDA
jgi:hypothetical protein